MSDWYLLPSQKAIEQLGSSTQGLSEHEAKKRLEKYGPNEFTKREGDSLITVFVRQFKSTIIMLLLAASIVSFFLGDILESIIILLILFINAIVGTYHEYNAQNALAALKKLQTHEVNLLREGKELVIDAKYVVIGDIVILRAGDKIPADGRIIESASLYIDESILTGESSPVLKSDGQLHSQKELADRTNMAYSSTFVTQGRGLMLITETDDRTEIGKIYRGVSSPPEIFPLQVKINDFSSLLGKAAVLTIFLFMLFFIFVLGPDFGYGLNLVLKLSIAQAVSFIPEGLPIVVTIALAIGVSAMARHNAITRRLQAIETIGGIDVLCADKTGTLTINKMSVQEIVISKKAYCPSQGQYFTCGKNAKVNALEISGMVKIIETGILCNDSSFDEKSKKRIGDPVEIALVDFAQKFSYDKHKYSMEHQRIAEIQFSPQNKYMVSANRRENKINYHLKGAPEVVLNFCTHSLENGRRKKLSAKERKEYLSITSSMAKRGLRVLAFAQKEKQKKISSLERGYTFLGLIGFADPLRPGVHEAIERAERAGVRIVMITGDHSLTAQSIAREAGILKEKNDLIITGEQITKMGKTALSKIIDGVKVFARVTGEHKAIIVDILKKKGHLVAMTGDGVNDAIALKEAHVGVSLGSATDVAKEASDIILTDDHLSSIVDAIEEGRHSSLNIKKVIKYLFSTNMAEVLFLLAIILSPLWAGSMLPLALLPIHIIFVNLVTDGFLDVSLATEPKEKGLMKIPSSFFRRSLFSSDVNKFIAISSAVMALGMFATYLFYIDSGISLVHKQTIFFTTLAFFQIWAVQNARSRYESAFTLGFFSNKYLAGATIFSILVQLFAIYHPAMNELLKTYPLALSDWFVVIGVSSSIFIAFEALKFARRRNIHVAI
ncbi:MAG: cation-transporting P-type ATPase [Candidatus Micrarchaeota archaeon]